jgi:hypothetical protein
MSVFSCSLSANSDEDFLSLRFTPHIILIILLSMLSSLCLLRDVILHVSLDYNITGRMQRSYIIYHIGVRTVHAFPEVTESVDIDNYMIILLIANLIILLIANLIIMENSVGLKK